MRSCLQLLSRRRARHLTNNRSLSIARTPGMLPSAWSSVASSLSLPPRAAEAVMSSIESRYAEPWRHYHNLNHIEELLSLAAAHSHSISDTDFMTLSIVFHDIVYYVDSRSPDNEKESADLFRELVGESILNEELTRRVFDAIVCTKSHAVPDSADGDLKLFMDFDMAILGAPRPKYAEYALNIRREYGAVPGDAYCAGRSAFFRSYLATTSNIYATPLFRSTHEEAARRNIEWECAILESGRLVSEADIN